MTTPNAFKLVLYYTGEKDPVIREDLFSPEEVLKVITEAQEQEKLENFLLWVESKWFSQDRAIFNLEAMLGIEAVT